MPRAYWKGHLKLSLVSNPVELFNAVDSSAGISFRQIHKPSGRRINYEKVVQGVGKVDNVDIVKGYETGKDHSIPCRGFIPASPVPSSPTRRRVPTLAHRR